MTVPIRYTTDDTRSAEQAQVDDQIREDVERTGGRWAQMTAEQREQTLARLRDKKQRAQAARARKQGELEALEHRVARLEERVGRLEG
jgi:L-lactate utilization protein LutB